MALYNRYRPQRFAELVGQEHVVRTLQNALSHNRLSHAYLFSGERGTGKTTAARLLAKAVNCLEGVQAEPCGACRHCTQIVVGTFLDLVEVDAASHTGIDDVRELRDQAQFTPTSGRHKVYIIDEVHQLSSAAKDALLKTLEEPPARTLFVLATTEPHRVPATIRSRCQHLSFRRIGPLALVARMREIVESEKATIDDRALNILARHAGGSLRDAISLLDQALAFSEGEVSVEAVNSMLGLSERDAVLGLIQHLGAGDAAAGLRQIDAAIQAGNSPNTLRHQAVELLRDLLLAKTNPAPHELERLGAAEADELVRLTAQFELGQIVRALEIFAAPEPPSRGGGDPILELELAFARAVLAVHRPSEAPASAQAAQPPAPTRQPDTEKAAGAPVVVAKEEAPKQTEQTEQAAPAIADGDLSVDMIRERTEQWIERVRAESRFIAPYAAQAEVAEFADDVVTLSYRGEMQLNFMERPDARRVVVQALSQTFGRPLEVRNVLGKRGTQPRRAASSKTREDDPVVRVAMREYGAQPVGEDEKV